jgi:hypothetical protein
MRLVASCLVLVACRGSVLVEGGSSDPGAAGADGGGGSGAAPAAGGAGAGVEWTHDPAQTYSGVTCERDGMVLLVEIWPGGAACVSDRFVRPEDVLVLVLGDWDGQPGTYTIGDETVHGTAGARGIAEGSEGTITVEPFADTPRWFSWMLSVAEGRTDLGPCGQFDDFGCVEP